MNKINKLIAVLLVIMTAISLAGCSKNKNAKSVDASKPKSPDAISYVTNQVDSVSSNVSLTESEEANKTVIDFGEGTIFDGIGISSDENGEIVCTEINGALWYKIEDKRFSTYNKLKQYVYNSLGSKNGAKMMSNIKPYFADKDNGLYFVNGINGVGIESYKSYLLNDSNSNNTLNLTVSVSHNKEYRKKTGIVRSHIDFAKEDGKWKLENIELFGE